MKLTTNREKERNAIERWEKNNFEKKSFKNENNAVDFDGLVVMMMTAAVLQFLASTGTGTVQRH